MTNKNKGIFFIILSALGFAFMSLFVKLSGDIPSMQKSFFRNLVSLVFAFYIIKKSTLISSKEFSNKHAQLATIEALSVQYFIAGA